MINTVSKKPNLNQVAIDYPETTRKDDSTRKLTRGLSFIVDKIDDKNSTNNRIIEVEECSPAVFNRENTFKKRSSSDESDSDLRSSNAPSMNPQVDDVRQFAPNYDDLHGYME